MSIIELWLVSFFITLIWFDVLFIQYQIKKLFKIPLVKFVKPWDCRYCTTHHIGLLTGIVYYLLIDYNLVNLVLYTFINYSLSNIIIKIYERHT